jgi:uncharacterized coiled-coil protein SlyX
MPNIEPNLASWEHRIADLEGRIAEQKMRVLRGEGDIVSSLSVLELMEQTLEGWRSTNKSLSSTAKKI